MEKKKCPECGQEIDEAVMICPYCGYTVQKTSERSEQVKKIQNKGRILLVIACALMIAAFFKVNNKTYTFYKEHYQKCMEGYAENKNSAEMYTGGMFKSSYNYIASEYETMAKKDRKEIRNYRIQAILLSMGSIVCGVAGYRCVKREKENGTGKMS